MVALTAERHRDGADREARRHEGAEEARGIEGLQGLSKAGLRYPIMPYGPQADPGEGMAKSYSDKS